MKLEKLTKRTVRYAAADETGEDICRTLYVQQSALQAEYGKFPEELVIKIETPEVE